VHICNDRASHYLLAVTADPPAELLAQLFPWVEEEAAKLTARQRSNRYAQDVALQHFLRALLWFHTVILQDAAVLYAQHPEAGIFKFAPFTSPAFHVFTGSSTSRIAEVEHAARMAFENLPDNLVRGLRGAIAAISIEHQKSINMNTARFDAFQQMLVQISGTVDEFGRSHKSHRKKVSIAGA